MTAFSVSAGPWLLRPNGCDLADHRARYGTVPVLDAPALIVATDAADVRGRGGAGYPFSAKVRTAVGRKARHRHVVVNLSEGEPASAKDAALAVHTPHLVLDGAALTAQALQCSEIHLVVPGDRPVVGTALRRAVAERARAREDHRLTWTVATAGARFVSGESTAVTELINGRPNLPVSRWTPTAESGVAGRPTVLANAETFAQVAALVLDPAHVPGPTDEPGTRLLSLTRAGAITVLEVAHRTPWTDVLTAEEIERPVLLGGYHGTWAPAGALRDLTVSASQSAAGLPLGAGVVIPLAERRCPVLVTDRILHYLARQSAGRCGPCVNGLPALAQDFSRAATGRGTLNTPYWAALVDGRGACAHPDGTARLALSAAQVFAEEIALHESGRCSLSTAVAGAR
jgi:NADH:ubiquinone oxidoreductase subunit F (NADH-binding)